jgi:hypothetical protein
MAAVHLRSMQGPNARQTREVWRAGGGTFLLSTLDLWSASMKFQHLLGPDERFETMVLPCDENGFVEDVSEFVHRVRAGMPAASHDLAVEWLQQAYPSDAVGPSEAGAG